MAMSSKANSNEQGKVFENLVYDLLDFLRKENLGDVETTPGAVEIKRHPRIELYDSNFLIPDFELIYRLHHTTNHVLIECQDRKRSSQEIIRKIRHIKSLSCRNNFISIYNRPIANVVVKALISNGIRYYDLSTFIVFLAQSNYTLAMIKGIDRGQLMGPECAIPEFIRRILETFQNVLPREIIVKRGRLERMWNMFQDTEWLNP